MYNFIKSKLKLFLLLVVFFSMSLNASSVESRNNGQKKDEQRFPFSKADVLKSNYVKHGGSKNAMTLKFKSDKTFKVVQFTDTQDDQDTDSRTIELIETVLDDQKPDLVIYTGDNVVSGPQSVENVKKAIDNIVKPVNDRKIPWFITFGNHDEDHTSVTGMDKEALLDYYMTYKYNINKASSEEITGTGNMYTYLYHSAQNGKSEPAFVFWGLDSGKYAPDTIADQSTDELPGWDWIHSDQINWYQNTSKAIEKKYGNIIPGLMFFHIPLWEFSYMWANKDAHNVTGEKNETECPGAYNSGLFTAMMERGDIKGVFCGHDHVNNYMGNYFGIYLGYSANTGFGTYGLSGDEKNRLRGARVFILNEDDIETFESYMVYAIDYGIQ